MWHVGIDLHRQTLVIGVEDRTGGGGAEAGGDLLETAGALAPTA
jgi:hypothetical protein